MGLNFKKIAIIFLIIIFIFLGSIIFFMTQTTTTLSNKALVKISKTYVPPKYSMDIFSIAGNISDNQITAISTLLKLGFGSEDIDLRNFTINIVYNDINSTYKYEDLTIIPYQEGSNNNTYVLSNGDVYKVNINLVHGINVSSNFTVRYGDYGKFALRAKNSVTYFNVTHIYP